MLYRALPSSASMSTTSGLVPRLSLYDIGLLPRLLKLGFVSHSTLNFVTMVSAHVVLGSKSVVSAAKVTMRDVDVKELGEFVVPKDNGTSTLGARGTLLGMISVLLLSTQSSIPVGQVGTASATPKSDC